LVSTGTAQDQDVRSGLFPDYPYARGNCLTEDLCVTEVFLFPVFRLPPFFPFKTINN
jgi:hypothetical protein